MFILRVQQFGQCGPAFNLHLICRWPATITHLLVPINHNYSPLKRTSCWCGEFQIVQGMRHRRELICPKAPSHVIRTVCILYWKWQYLALSLSRFLKKNPFQVSVFKSTINEIITNLICKLFYAHTHPQILSQALFYNDHMQDPLE